MPQTPRIALWYDGDIDDDAPTFTAPSSVGGLNETDDENAIALVLANPDIFDVRGMVANYPDGNLAGINRVLTAYGDCLPNLQTHAPGRFKTVAQLQAICYQGATNASPAAGYRVPGNSEYAQMHAAAQAFITEAAKHSPSSTDPFDKIWILEGGPPILRAQVNHEAVTLGQMPDIWKRVRTVKPSKQNDTRDPNSRRYLMGYGNDDATAGQIGYGPSGIKGPAGDMSVIQWGKQSPSRQEVACNDTTTAGKAFFDADVREHGSMGALMETWMYQSESTDRALYFRAADAVAVWWLARAYQANNFEPTAANPAGRSRLYNGEAWIDSPALASIAVTKTGWMTGWADEQTEALDKTDWQAFVRGSMDRYLAPASGTPNLGPPVLMQPPTGFMVPSPLTFGATIPVYRPKLARGVWGGSYPMTYSYQLGHRIGAGAITPIGSAASSYAALTVPTFTDSNAHQLVLTVTATNAQGAASTTVVIGTISGDGSGVADTTAPTITSTATFSVAENAGFSQQLAASETVTWSIVGGADAALFAISSGGLLTMAARDYESPGDVGANNVYDVTVRAADAAGNAANQSIAVTVTDAAETSEDADAAAWMATATVAPTTGQRSAYDTFVKALKTAGVWAKTDGLQFFAAHDEAMALRDPKRAASATKAGAGTVTHTPAVGFAAAGGGYLLPGLTLTQAANFLQNDASLRAYQMTATGQSGNGRVISTDTNNVSLTPSSSAAQMVARLNSSTSLTSTSGGNSVKEYFYAGRTSSAAIDRWRGLTAITGGSIPASTTKGASPLRYLADAAGVSADGSFAFVALGASLSQAEREAERAAVRALITALGGTP